MRIHLKRQVKMVCLSCCNRVMWSGTLVSCELMTVALIQTSILLVLTHTNTFSLFGCTTTTINSIVCLQRYENELNGMRHIQIIQCIICVSECKFLGKQPKYVPHVNKSLIANADSNTGEFEWWVAQYRITTERWTRTVEEKSEQTNWIMWLSSMVKSNKN